MTKMPFETIALDYRSAATAEILENLSGLAFGNGHLWTVSDEGRSLECLKLSKEGFELVQQYNVAKLFPTLLRNDAEEKAGELDLESIDLVNGTLWLCGSHCNVRKSAKLKNTISSVIRSRPSRHFLACIKVKTDGFTLGKAKLAPAKGRNALRRVLAADPYLKPFIDLPSKENGLDIEGLAVMGDEVFLGLRGPILDNNAVVVRVRLDATLIVQSRALSFLNLGGLAVRDLSRHGEKVYIIAGPVGDAEGPFRLYCWSPNSDCTIQHPVEIFTWTNGTEKPEGLCVFENRGRIGHLFVHDRPRADQVVGTTYSADWLPL